MVDVVTIGAYGWNKPAFFGALARERVGVFCDVRRRRGVRGSEYAFVNSIRLQGRLDELGIEYRHCLDLAPSTAVRRLQVAADEIEGVAKRDRSKLGPVFAQAFADECLASFDAPVFLAELGSLAPICLFCVEREPAACHRSLIGDALAHHGAAVRHLLP